MYEKFLVKLDNQFNICLSRPITHSLSCSSLAIGSVASAISGVGRLASQLLTRFDS